MWLSLDNLSTEILVKIFKYLDVSDLCKLKQTCKRINEVIKTWEHLFIKSCDIVVTNQFHAAIRKRSAKLLTPFERFRISANWRHGIYNETKVLETTRRYIPWIQLEEKLLWSSRGDVVRAHKRTAKGIQQRHPVHVIKGHTEVSRFVKKGDYLLTGLTDGTLYLWSNRHRKFIFYKKGCHDADINSVDMCFDVLASGSRDNYVKAWRLPKATNKLQKPLFKIDLEDRVWSVALNEGHSSLLAVGTAGITYTTTLTICDLIKEKPVLKLGTDNYAAGILDMKWDSASTLWSCGYDAHLRRWDLRVGTCVQTFEDPCNSVMYCFEYDRCNTILSGTQNNGRVVLWDTRQKDYIQMYFMDCCKRCEKNSPIYGLSFDAELLFTATDRHVSILDFSVFNGKFNDYSNLFKIQNLNK